jgi:hypothetical protein
LLGPFTELGKSMSNLGDMAFIKSFPDVGIIIDNFTKLNLYLCA